MKYLPCCLLLACLASLKCWAGETFSQAFYSGEDSALAAATTEAIHFNAYARLARQAQPTAAAQDLKDVLVKAITPLNLERPVYQRGFQLNTLSTDDGFEFQAAYRF